VRLKSKGFHDGVELARTVMMGEEKEGWGVMRSTNHWLSGTANCCKAIKRAAALFKAEEPHI
jgi:hypothetical protein